MKEKILYVIKNTFKLKSVGENVSQKNCEKWDSMNHLNLIIELESEFDVSFEPEEIAEMTDINQIERILRVK